MKFLLININLLLDPLEQFELTWYSSINLNSAVLVLIFNLFIVTILFKLMRSITIFGYLMDVFFNFFKSVFLTIIPWKHQEFFYIYFYMFIFIFLNNLIGMIGYAYTLTSCFIITIFLSFVVVGSTLFVFLENNRFQFFNYFYPKGTPSIILYLLIFIELISYIIKFFSLAIRLFANMVAGHTLLKISLSFVCLGLSMFNVFSVISIFFWSLIIIITLLEISIAFLQAYVFVFLGLIYLSESL